MHLRKQRLVRISQHNTVQIISVQKGKWCFDKMQFWDEHVFEIFSLIFGLTWSITLEEVGKGNIRGWTIDVKSTTWIPKMSIKDNSFSSAFEMLRN